jgi:hypothetical protein
MSAKDSDDQFSDEEATRRMNDALRRALTTRPKPQKEMVGKAGKVVKRGPTKGKLVKGDR